MVRPLVRPNNGEFPQLSASHDSLTSVLPVFLWLSHPLKQRSGTRFFSSSPLPACRFFQLTPPGQCVFPWSFPPSVDSGAFCPAFLLRLRPGLKHIPTFSFCSSTHEQIEKTVLMLLLTPMSQICDPPFPGDGSSPP